MATSRTTTHIRLSVMMFLQFFIWGAFYVPLGTYLAGLFKGNEAVNTIIGQSYATTNWAAIIAPLFVGLVADRFFRAERVNAVLHLLGGGLLFYCSTLTDSGALFRGLLAYFCCYMPTLALVNTIAFRNVENAEREFPNIRLWGTIGWIVSCLVVAQSLFGLVSLPVLPGIGDAGSTAFPMKLAAVVSLVYGVYSFTLPACPPVKRAAGGNAGDALGLNAFRLFADPAFAVFAACSFLICIPLAFYYAQANGFAKEMAFGEKTTSVMALGQVSEILFMALVPFFLRKLGVKWMLLVGMTAWLLRYALFGLMPSMPAMIVTGIVLHGICYDFFFVTGQLYTDRKAPPELRASAQGLISLLTYGLGMLVGSYVLGWWGDHIHLDPSSKAGWLAGAKQFWLLPAIIAGAVAVIFSLTFRDKSKSN